MVSGDEIGFRIREHSVELIPLKKRPLSGLRGVLRATTPFIGVEAIRRDVGRHLGVELERKLRQR